MAEINHSFTADNVVGPVKVNKTVEFFKIKRSATKINECTYSVLFGLPFFMMVMVVMMAMFATFVRILVGMFVVVMMLVGMLVMVVFMFMLMFIFYRTFNFLYPSCRSRHIFKIKKMSFQQFI